jgi:hypothetical protein
MSIFLILTSGRVPRRLPDRYSRLRRPGGWPAELEAAASPRRFPSCAWLWKTAKSVAARRARVLAAERGVRLRMLWMRELACSTRRQPAPLLQPAQMAVANRGRTAPYGTTAPAGSTANLDRRPANPGRTVPFGATASTDGAFTLMSEGITSRGRAEIFDPVMCRQSGARRQYRRDEPAPAAARHAAPHMAPCPPCAPRSSS